MRYSSMLRNAATLFTLCFVAACDGAENSVGPTPTPPSPAPSAATGTIRVTNTSSSSIWFVYFSPCSSTDWGIDRLGTDVILSGASMQWTSIGTGCWDVKAVLEDGRAAERLGLTVNAGAVTEFRPASSAFTRTATVADAAHAPSVRGTKQLP